MEIFKILILEVNSNKMEDAKRLVYGFMGWQEVQAVKMAYPGWVPSNVKGKKRQVAAYLSGVRSLVPFDGAIEVRDKTTGDLLIRANRSDKPQVQAALKLLSESAVFLYLYFYDTTSVTVEDLMALITGQSVTCGRPSFLHINEASQERELDMGERVKSYFLGNDDLSNVFTEIEFYR